jgi:hypothetical protein
VCGPDETIHSCGDDDEFFSASAFSASDKNIGLQLKEDTQKMPIGPRGGARPPAVRPQPH